MSRPTEEAISTDGLITSFLEDGEIEFNSSLDKPTPIVRWMEGVDLGGRPFSLEGHEYQREILENTAQRQVYKKAAQMGFTQIAIGKTLHGLVSGRFPQGALYLFPNENLASEFCKTRFDSLISENPKTIGKFIAGSDSVSVKKIRKAHLFFRGARSTQKIENIKRTAANLLSIPTDLNIYDEVDLFEPSMIELAGERLSHSTIQEELFIGCPTIPGYGVDKLFEESDQRMWAIKCSHCGTDTILELEFPQCLQETTDGQVIRVCKKCGKEIFPSQGKWIAQYPSREKDMVGFYISQLNSAYVSPRKILHTYRDLSGQRKLQEFMNSKIGTAYVSSENRITPADVYRRCGQDPLAIHDIGPCCMGADIGNLIHVVIACRPRQDVLQVLWVGKLTNWNELGDLQKRYNIKAGVIDSEPELHKAREFANAAKYTVFLADYVQSASGVNFDHNTKMVKLNRTEGLDKVHSAIMNPKETFVLPRRCDSIEEYARQVSNSAKVLQEDETGGKSYKWIKTGDDHFLHASLYCLLASEHIGISQDPWFEQMKPVDHYETFYDPFAKERPEPGDRYDSGEGYDPFRG